MRYQLPYPTESEQKPFISSEGKESVDAYAHFASASDACKKEWDDLFSDHEFIYKGILPDTLIIKHGYIA